MSKITWIGGAMYNRPTCIEGVSYPDRTFSHRVGSPFEITGPTITHIDKTRDGHGIADFYDRLTVWTGSQLLFECPAWLAEVEYEHDKNANEAPEW